MTAEEELTTLKEENAELKRERKYNQDAWRLLLTLVDTFMLILTAILGQTMYIYSMLLIEMAADKSPLLMGVVGTSLVESGFRIAFLLCAAWIVLTAVFRINDRFTPEIQEMKRKIGVGIAATRGSGNDNVGRNSD